MYVNQGPITNEQLLCRNLLVIDPVCESKRNKRKRAADLRLMFAYLMAHVSTVHFLFRNTVVTYNLRFGSPKTCIGDSKLSRSVRVDGGLSFCVALRWTGDLFRVEHRLHPIAVAIGSSRTPQTMSAEGCHLLEFEKKMTVL